MENMYEEGAVCAKLLACYRSPTKTCFVWQIFHANSLPYLVQHYPVRKVKKLKTSAYEKNREWVRCAQNGFDAGNCHEGLVPGAIRHANAHLKLFVAPCNPAQGNSKNKCLCYIDTDYVL